MLGVIFKPGKNVTDKALPRHASIHSTSCDGGGRILFLYYVSSTTAFNMAHQGLVTQISAETPGILNEVSCSLPSPLPPWYRQASAETAPLIGHDCLVPNSVRH
jgi:hypothetical protein